MIEYLTWDSNFFDMRIGKSIITTSSDWKSLILELQDDSLYDLLYIYDETRGVSPLDVAKLVDIKVLYGKKIKYNDRIESNCILQFTGDNPDEDLYSLALISGQCSRYKLDSRFPEGSYERLYSRWIENSVSGQIADAVLFYEENGHKIGMTTLSINGKNASIGLIAVDEKVQGKGIGTKLILASEQWLYDRGIDTLYVATQKNNIQGCNFYHKLGFSCVAVTNIYHLWR